MKKCRCGHNNYEWTVDSQLKSWLKCADCGENFFDDGIGVILINWDATNIDEIDLTKCVEKQQEIVDNAH